MRFSLAVCRLVGGAADRGCRITLFRCKGSSAKEPGRLLNERWPSHEENQVSGPLSGIQVLDLTRALSGPFCTMLLGDLGAEIIKVEAPGKGDDSRSWGPPFVGQESCYFFCANRNKKSIAVNLKSKEGRNIIRKLAVKSDVFIENFLPEKLSSLGLGYEDLQKIAPRLIYCSITGFGPTGPLSQKPGYDLIAAARGGLLDITGPEGGDSCKVGIAVADLTTGLFAHGAIMAAILERQRTGGQQGQKIDCNLLSSLVACLTGVASSYLNGGLLTRRRGTAHESIVPYQAYATKDGQIVVGIGNERHFQQLCLLMSLERLVNDERFASNTLRVANRNALNEILKKRFQERRTEEWMVAFEDAPFPCDPINTLDDVFRDPQVLHNKMVVDMQHPTVGNIKVLGPAVMFGNGGNFVRSPPPTLGQHTDEILGGLLDMEEQEIQQLKQDAVIQ